MKTEPFLFFFYEFYPYFKNTLLNHYNKRVLRRFKKGLKNKFVLLKDGILKDDKGIKEYPK
ncbi:hypothetical protein [Helicobacter pylori]|uniref:hypothetical protein n=1 Tax=Helicobacter pylori TaxID=210 RepID=UPI000BEC9E21|nr:hypothetical protein [Helicobacter pylori]PDW52619.1 hypothetical protein BB437_03125 [Helicobacter pylori]